ncbi:MAG: alanine--glyoxylate aminotransferase family protein [Pirellulales bacterium]|nr:alanine--glyoxylate aminotransferase family protein [Pirellulales bacterium]
MPKKRLLTPGPTQVPEAALLSLARQVTHHRTPEFVGTFAAVQRGLQAVLRTAEDVIVLAGSGTAGMEAALVNSVPRGGKVLVLNAGVFAQRWAKLAAAFDIEVLEHTVPWGQAVDPADVRRLLVQHPGLHAVCGTLMESSTGVAHDVRAIGEIVSHSNALWIVDGISGVGVQECRMDEWGVDVLVVGGQKALMLPPGLAIVAASQKAWQAMEQIRPQAFYLDLRLHREKLRSAGSTPWTPAHTLIGALAQTLPVLTEPGMEAVWRHARRLGAAARAGGAAIGWRTFALRPADGMTAFAVPPGVDATQFLAILERRYGVKLAAGQLSLKGQIVRLAHMGLIDELDILSALAGMELVMAELGQPVTLGSGVAAASQVLLAGLE